MVDIDPARLSANGVAAQDVVNAVLQSNLTIPAGDARIGSLDFDVTVNNSPLTVPQFGQISLKSRAGNTVISPTSPPCTTAQRCSRTWCA